jgi:hypothetical protein
MHELDEGDTITIDTHNQVLEVTEVMFGGEIIDLEGPRGGEKSLVENVNTGAIAVMENNSKVGTVTEIHV